MLTNLFLLGLLAFAVHVFGGGGDNRADINMDLLLKQMETLNNRVKTTEAQNLHLQDRLAEMETKSDQLVSKMDSLVTEVSSSTRCFCNITSTSEHNERKRQTNVGQYKFNGTILFLSLMFILSRASSVFRCIGGIDFQIKNCYFTSSLTKNHQ